VARFRCFCGDRTSSSAAIFGPISHPNRLPLLCKPLKDTSVRGTDHGMLIMGDLLEVHGAVQWHC
jgi:hypothetical protein